MGHVKRDFHLNESICGEFIYKKGTFWLHCFQALFGRWMRRAESEDWMLASSLRECWASWQVMAAMFVYCGKCWVSWLLWTRLFMVFLHEFYLFIDLFILRCMAKMREMKITVIIIMSQMALRSEKLIHYFIHNYVKWIF